MSHIFLESVNFGRQWPPQAIANMGFMSVFVGLEINKIAEDRWYFPRYVDVTVSFLL